MANYEFESKDAAKSATKPIKNKAGAEKKIANFAYALVDSAVYSGIQSPITAVSQITDSIFKTKLTKNTKFIASPKSQKFNTADWYAQQIGYGLGIGVDFLLANKVVGLGKSSLGIETASSLNLARSTMIGQSALSGAIFEGVFTPSQSGQNLIDSRLKQALSGAVTFAALSGSSLGLKMATQNIDLGSKLANNVIDSNILNGFLSGIPGGIVSSNSDSILNGKGIASFHADVASVTAFSVAGLPLSLGHAFELTSDSTKQQMIDNAINKRLNQILLESEFDKFKPVKNPFDTFTDAIAKPNPDSSLDSNNKSNISENSTLGKKSIDLNSNIESLILDENGNFLNDPMKNFDTKIYDSLGNLSLDFKFSFPDLAKLGEPDLRFSPQIKLAIDNLQADQNLQSVKLNDGSMIKRVAAPGYMVEFNDGYKLLISQDSKNSRYSSLELSAPNGNKINKYTNNAGIYLSTVNGTKMEFLPSSYIIKLSDGQTIVRHNNGEISYSRYLNKNDDFSTFNLKLMPDSNNAKVKNNQFYFEATSTNGTKFMKFTNRDHFVKFNNGQTITKIDNHIVSLNNDGQEYHKDSRGNLTVTDKNIEYKELIDKITRKISNNSFTQEQFDSILSAFNDPKDRAIASELISQNKNYMSYDNMMESFRLLKADPRLTDSNFLYTQSLTSSGNMLAYLFRKSTGLKADILPISDYDWTLHKGHVLVFDDLNKFSPKELEKFRLAEYNILLFNSHKFDTGPNFLDLSLDTLKPKLEKLINIVKTHQLSNPSLSDTEAVKQILDPPIQLNKLLENHLSKNIEIKQVDLLDSESNNSDRNFVNNKIIHFQNKYFTNFVDRLESARILADSTIFTNFSDLVYKLRDLHHILQENIVKPDGSDLKYIVGLDGQHGAHSSALINYLYKVSNNIPNEAFISKNEYEFRPKDEIERNHFVVLDDSAYSGSQLKNIFNRRLYFGKNIHFGLISSYEDFTRNNSTLDSEDKMNIISTQSNLNLNSAKELALISSLTKLIPETNDGVIKNKLISQFQSALLRLPMLDTKDSWGSGRINSTEIFPHMVSDTTLPLVNRFASEVLKTRT